MDVRSSMTSVLLRLKRRRAVYGSGKCYTRGTFQRLIEFPEQMDPETRDSITINSRCTFT